MAFTAVHMFEWRYDYERESLEKYLPWTSKVESVRTKRRDLAPAYLAKASIFMPTPAGLIIKGTVNKLSKLIEL